MFQGRFAQNARGWPTHTLRRVIEDLGISGGPAGFERFKTRCNRNVWRRARLFRAPTGPKRSASGPARRIRAARAPATGLVRPLVQGGRDAAQGSAFAAQPSDFIQGGLLGRIRFDVLPVVGQPGAERYVTHTGPPWLRLCRSASRVRSPIASRSHWLTAPMMVITRRPAAEPVSSDSATETSATLRFSNSSSKPHRSLTLRVSRSSLATNTT